MKYLFLFSLLLTFSCSRLIEYKTPVEPGPPMTTPDKPVKPATPVVIVEEPAPVQSTLKFEWNHEYNDWFLVESIKKYGKALLTKKPRDWNQYIKVWPKTEQGLIKFWGNILVKMAYYESKWDGSKKYKENFKDSKGRWIYSRGLFQLSIESGRGYKCPFKKESDLHVDSKNIECAVRILNRWVDRDGVIASKKPYRGGARYWAVLRGHRTYTKQSLAGIKKANQ